MHLILQLIQILDIKEQTIYIIYLDCLKQKMHEQDKGIIIKDMKNELLQSTQLKVQNIQALLKLRTERPVIQVEFGNQIIFKCSCSFQTRQNYFSWLWKENSTQFTKNEQQNANSTSQFNTSNFIIKNIEKNRHQNQSKSKAGSNQQIRKHQQELLYTQQQIGLLKKKLQFQHKGLLSKSTDVDSTLNIVVLYRFKCKNASSTNHCPFLHILEYSKEENGRLLYKHRPFCSTHTSDCTLDDQNIQYNVTMRKIDSSMHILENIIKNDPFIKPKEILQLFSEHIQEGSQNFLYEGLQSKNIRRSIKKYFDNAVAKVKSKLRPFF